MNPGPDFQPMEPLPALDIPSSSNYIYQVKWDGVRMIAWASANRVRLINKRGHERTAQYPELQALPGSFPSHSFIVDGEVVVVKESGPDFPGVMQRDNTRVQPRIDCLKSSLPVDYVIFDLLQIDDESLLSLPLQERLHRLRRLFVSHPEHRFHLIDDFDDGEALFARVRQAGLEGIVAKAVHSPYLSGKKHHHWYKIKCLQQIRCLVGGYISRQGRIRSLLLGVRQAEELIYVGKAGSGLSAADWQQLDRELPRWQIDNSPFSRRIAVSGQETLHYVKPILQILIEYREWTPHLQLRHPVIKGLAIDALSRIISAKGFGDDNWQKYR